MRFVKLLRTPFFRTPLGDSLCKYCSVQPSANERGKNNVSVEWTFSLTGNYFLYGNFRKFILPIAFAHVRGKFCFQSIYFIFVINTLNVTSDFIKFVFSLSFENVLPEFL